MLSVFIFDDYGKISRGLGVRYKTSIWVVKLDKLSILKFWEVCEKVKMVASLTQLFCPFYYKIKAEDRTDR